MASPVSSAFFLTRQAYTDTERLNHVAVDCGASM